MIPYPMTEAELSIRDIGKQYGPNIVLSDIDLDVRTGEVLALLVRTGPESRPSLRSLPALSNRRREP